MPDRRADLCRPGQKMLGTRYYYYVGLRGAGGRQLRAALLASTALVAAGLPAAAQDATWLASPGSVSYNSDANWSSGTVPAGTAFFGASNITGLSLFTNDFSNETDVGGWTFNAGAGNYTFANGQFLNFNGAGIVINGGSATITVLDQNSLNFLNASTAGSATITNNGGGILNFYNASTAGSATITNNPGGTLRFYNTSTAGYATITNNPDGILNFYDKSTAGTATITTYSGVFFYGTSTAGSATITNNAALDFNNNSTAGSAAIINNFVLGFFDNSTAGSATITNNGAMDFGGASTAGNATITNSGGNLYFLRTSTAGNAAITNTASGTVDFSGSAGPARDNRLSGGSIAGAGNFYLGAR